jgi:hypothetical protein
VVYLSQLSATQSQGEYSAGLTQRRVAGAQHGNGFTVRLRVAWVERESPLNTGLPSRTLAFAQSVHDPDGGD